MISWLLTILARIIMLSPRASPGSEFVHFCLRRGLVEAVGRFFSALGLRQGCEVVQDYGPIVGAGEQVVLLCSTVFLMLLS